MRIEAKKILVKYWGYPDFRPMQEEIILSVAEGHDTLALLPTGGGKSICFQVPALMSPGTCIVVTPLIALMKDQVNNLKKVGIKAAAIYTGMHKSEIESIYSNVVAGTYKFFYVSPERLDTEIFKEVISRVKVNLLTVDEAHCVSQWGYDFRPPYLRIAEIRPYIPNVPVLALTATATPEVVSDIMNKLEFKRHRVFRTTFERTNLAYHVAKEYDKPAFLMRFFADIKGSGIVYVRNRKKTRELAEILTKKGVSATFYHAGLDAHTRDERQKQWSTGQVKVMVSTNAFGMGIDKADVRKVVHYDLPDCVESYFQEAGRAGRDQKPSQAVLLYTPHDVVNVKDLLKASYPPIDEIKTIYNALGNYLQLPEGGGKDISFDFRISDFASNYNFNLLQVYNALKILERDGYLMYIESAGQYSKLFVPLSKEDLYRFMVENSESERIIKEIMRSYSGIFTDYININENMLAKRADMNVDVVVKQLNYLAKVKVLTYIPVSTQPQLVFTSGRLNAKYIQLSDQNYRFLKEAAEKRLDALLRFITDNLKCRSQQLLAYFGEQKSQRCGICDVCMSKNKTNLNELEFEQLVESIKLLLVQKPRYLNDIFPVFTQYTEEQIIDVVRWLMDHDKIIRLKDESLIWHDQLNLTFE
ncbi:MAG: ATP-dependent DNA helicase RecQ [Bacteroidales bacterium]|jgi:ATP-dependent DNA helicase RecQ